MSESLEPTTTSRFDPRRLGVIGASALVAALGLFALRADAGESPLEGMDASAVWPDATAAAPEADGGVAEAAPAEETAEVEPGAEGSDGEGEAADFALPSFADLTPIPREKDFLALAQVREGKLVFAPEATPGQEQSVPERALTIDPRYQKKLTDLLKSYAVPFGAVAAIEPATGRVLALAEHSQDAPSMRGLPLKAVYPAASVFKMVTGAALLGAGVSADASVCYHGGKRRLNPRLLEDSKRDGRCNTLSEAMGHSYNVVFAKLAKKNLEPKALRGWADKFGFNAPLAFDQPADVSVARIPDGEFEMAQTAAGFGEVFLSPLHGAMLAAAVGNKGVMRSPVLFEGDEGAARRVLDEAQAATLADMCETSVTEGTARRAFRERGRYALGDVKAAGKTGSIFSKDKPFRDFTWFVGWAPKENPKVAIAAVVVNGPLWRVRAPYVGREALRMFFEPPPTPRAKAKTKSKQTFTSHRYARASR